MKTTITEEKRSADAKGTPIERKRKKVTNRTSTKAEDAINLFVFFGSVRDNNCK